MWLKTRQNVTYLILKKAHPLFRSFPAYVFPEEADFASEGIDLNDLTVLLHLTANVSFKLNATVD
jgi:hypothetical protein